MGTDSRGVWNNLFREQIHGNNLGTIVLKLLTRTRTNYEKDCGTRTRTEQFKNIVLEQEQEQNNERHFGTMATLTTIRMSDYTDALFHNGPSVCPSVCYHRKS